MSLNCLRYYYHDDDDDIVQVVASGPFAIAPTVACFRPQPRLPQLLQQSGCDRQQRLARRYDRHHTSAATATATGDSRPMSTSLPIPPAPRKPAVAGGCLATVFVCLSAQIE